MAETPITGRLCECGCGLEIQGRRDRKWATRACKKAAYYRATHPSKAPWSGRSLTPRLCGCGCGQLISGFANKKYVDRSHRNRAWYARLDPTVRVKLRRVPRFFDLPLLTWIRTKRYICNLFRKGS